MPDATSGKRANWGALVMPFNASDFIPCVLFVLRHFHTLFVPLPLCFLPFLGSFLFFVCWFFYDRKDTFCRYQWYQVLHPNL